MPAIADIKSATNLSGKVLTQDAAVAGNVTLSPEGFIQPGVAKWVDRSGGIPIGFPTLTLSIRAPSRDSRVTRVQAKFVKPILEQTSPSTSTGIQPAATKAYELTANLEFLLPDRSALEERQLFFSQVKALLFSEMAASDGDPEVLTGSPIPAAVLNYERPF